MGARTIVLPRITFKSIRERKVSLVWWSVGIVFLGITVSSVYPAVRDSSEALAAYAENLPDAFKAAFSTGDLLDIASPAGFLNAELFSFMAPLLLLIFSIGFGAGATAGEEQDGTLDLLLSNPVTRRRVILEKFLAMFLGSSFLGLVMWGSLLVGTSAFDINVTAGRLAAACATTVLFGLAFGSIALAVGAATGRKGLAIGLAAAVAVASYVLNVASKIVEAVEPLERLSLFFYQIDADPVRNGLDLADAGLFVAVILVGLGISLVLFGRRDLSG